MITQKFNIYLHAGIAFAPVVHCSQYSQGETWTFTILDNDGSVYRPSSGALIGVKADGHTVAGISGTVNSDGSVSIVTTQQLTAAAGRGLFELTIDGGTNGTANFIIEVEKKPTDDGILSESDLSIIQQGLNSVTPQVIQETVSDYLEEHMTNPPIDPTLTVSNAAADAKVTGDKITDLKNAFQNLDNGKIEAVTTWHHASMLPDGSETTNANRIISDYMEIDHDYTDWGVNVVSGYEYMVQYYDANKTNVGGRWWLTNDFKLSDYYTGSYKYIRLAIKETATDASVPFSVGEQSEVTATAHLQEQITANTNDITANTNDIAEINKRFNSKQLVFSLDDFTIKGLPYKSDGTTMVASNWDRTELIDISAYKYLRYRASAFNVASLAVLQVLTFFDASKNYLSGLDTVSATSGTTVTGTIDVPTGAKYVSVLANANVTSYPYLIGYKSDIKVMCLGDSLTAGVYASDSQVHEKGYPYFMQKYIGDSYNIIKKGYPGQSAKTIWNSTSIMADIGNVSDIDEMIICLGTNGGYGSMETAQNAIRDYVEPYTDYNDFDKTNTIACYCAMIEKFYDDNPDINIILCIPPYAAATAPSGVEKNYDILKTAINNIADRYRLPVIDINHLMGVNMINTTHYQADGVHGNEQFYSRLGTLIGSQFESLSSFVYDE